MVVHYPRTVWKNSYAEHKVTGKNIQLKKTKSKRSVDADESFFSSLFSYIRMNVTVQCYSVIFQLYWGKLRSELPLMTGEK